MFRAPFTMHLHRCALVGSTSRGVLARGVSVTPLTDSSRALARIAEVCASARSSISIAQLAFDADCIPTRAVCNAAPQPFLDVLLAAARTRDVEVRVLLNGSRLLDTTPALRRALAAAGGERNIQIRSVRAFPRMMHMKLVVVDEHVAFLMGASLVNGYWDGARHTPDGHPAPPPGAGARPLHDVAIELRGSASAALARRFDAMWGTPSSKPVPASAPSKPFGGTVRVLRTAPRFNRDSGATEILDEYIEAIRRARKFIYLESQYFSARPIARALRDALAARPELEAIVLINQNPDITGYRGWQDARLRENGLLGHERVGVFSLWSATPSLQRAGRAEITQVFVHSKAAVIDDQWATVGTANLDGASLHSYGDDFGSRLGRRVFGRFRNFDINVALLDGAEDEPRTGAAERIRRELWARHLGPNVDVTNADGGWLTRWRDAANANVESLAAGSQRLVHGRVLPYVPNAHPAKQLGALGIDVDQAGLDLRFNPGATEVLCSPGWIKRLLPERMRGRIRT